MTEEQENKEYQRGFNYGYKIAQYDPELASLLKNIQAPSHIVDGFKEGTKQYEVDKSLDLYKETGKEITEEEKDKDIDTKGSALDFFREYGRTLTNPDSLDDMNNRGRNKGRDIDIEPD